jgi:hypothetical protein
MRSKRSKAKKRKKKESIPTWARRALTDLERRTLQYHIECCRNEIIALRSEVNSLRTEIMAMKEEADQLRRATLTN